MRVSFCSNERFCGAVNTVSSCIPSIGCSNPTEGQLNFKIPVTLLELDPKSVVLLVLSEKKLVKQTPLKVKK